MPTFSELKTRAISDLMKSYWKSVLVFVIFTFCTGTFFNDSPIKIISKIDSFNEYFSVSINRDNYEPTTINPPLNCSMTREDILAVDAFETPTNLLNTHNDTINDTIFEHEPSMVNSPVNILTTSEKPSQMKEQLAYSSSFNNSPTLKKTSTRFFPLDISAFFAFIATFLLIIVIICIVASLIKIFVLNPFELGTYKFFLSGTRESNAPLSTISYGFNSNYKNIVLVLFLRNLFIGLWTLLFIIPGIIKAYQYSMVPYIMAENCDLNYKEALSLSKKMMHGHKFEFFLLRLSFILWGILCALVPFHLLTLLYVGPYISFTNAEFYNALKAQYFAYNPPSLDVPQD